MIDAPKINLPYARIATIIKKFRTGTLDVVKFTETKSSDDIYGVATTLTSGTTTLTDVSFFWNDNVNNRLSQGGNLKEGRATAVINYSDKKVLSGDNIIIRKDGIDLRIDRIQEIPDTDEIMLNLEKITPL